MAASSRSLESLPYDLVHELCGHLEAGDIASFLGTCKTLYGFARDESIWREVCARCGAGEPDLFPGRSYYGVYTTLLHKYRSLLGHWASDHPYKGSIIEFRLSKEVGGIVGEVWRLWPNALFDWEARTATIDLPEYFTFVAIVPSAASSSVEVRWYEDPSYHSSFDWVSSAMDVSRASTLHVLEPTEESAFFMHEDVKVRVPDFPTSLNPVEPWYDHDRGLPLLPHEPSPRSLPDASQQTFPGELAVVTMGPTKQMKPAALVIRPPRGGPELLRHHEPRLLTRVVDMRNMGRGPDVEPFYRRFYPLRCPRPLMPLPPTSTLWNPASMEGIWLGTYTVRGTEVLYVSYHAGTHAVTAVKLIGNLEVPRGVMTWSFNATARVPVSELPEDTSPTVAAYLDELPGGLGWNDVQVFRAVTMASQAGFIEDAIPSSSDYAILLGCNTLLVTWRNLGPSFTSLVRRYPGRDLASEMRRGSPLLSVPRGTRHVPDDEVQFRIMGTSL